MDHYFESYEKLDVHQLMLNDKTRTLAYKNAIFNSQDKFKDRVVMDVGAGTGILSIFCAKVGARKVYAVEASGLADMIKKVAKENSEERIEVIHSKVEDIDPNNIEKVDIIVSEWMGFYLLHEGMLDSVLVARDRFLKDDGILFPCIAKLYAAPCQLPSMYKFWDDVYGVSMKCVGEEYRQMKAKNPEIMLVDKEDLLTEGKLLIWLDLQCLSAEELNVLNGEECVLTCIKDGKYQGICIWFAVEFPDGTELSTGPYDEPTHWKQTVIVLSTDMAVTKDEPLGFQLELKKDPEQCRRYKLELTVFDAEDVEHDIPCYCHMTKCIVARTYIEQQSKTDG